MLSSVAAASADSVIAQQWRLSSIPSLFIHMELSSASIKSLQCVITYSMPALRNPKRCDGTHPNIEIFVFCSFLLRFYPVYTCQSKNVSAYVYNHMDPVVMCCDCIPNPPCIVESNKDIFFTLHASHNHHHWEPDPFLALICRQGCLFFRGESSPKTRQGGLSGFRCLLVINHRQ